MSIIEAILLGIVQGITEFVPVSSSGHMVLVPYLLNLPTPDLNLIAVAHGGTLLALLVYFWRDLWRIALAFLEGLRQRRPFADPESRLGWYLIVGTIPAAVAGFLLEDFFDEVFGTPTVAALFLLGTAVLLVTGEYMLKRTSEKEPRQMSWADAIFIGLFQMLALFPGVSRSGSTMVGGLSRGLDRPTAARYSFLLSVPITTGAWLFKTVDLIQDGNVGAQMPFLLTTLVVSGIVGYACIHFLLEWLRRRSLYTFAIYCVVMSLVVLIFTAWGGGV
jgi:undecaprenyl-diphosphatase